MLQLNLWFSMEMLFMPQSEPMQHNQPIQAIHLYPYRKVLSKCVFYLWNRGYSLANCILGRAGVLPAVLLLDIWYIHVADDIVVDGNILTH